MKKIAAIVCVGLTVPAMLFGTTGATRIFMVEAADSSSTELSQDGVKELVFEITFSCDVDMEANIQAGFGYLVKERHLFGPSYEVTLDGEVLDSGRWLHWLEGAEKVFSGTEYAVDMNSGRHTLRLAVTGSADEMVADYYEGVILRTWFEAELPDAPASTAIKVWLPGSPRMFLPGGPIPVRLIFDDWLNLEDVDKGWVYHADMEDYILTFGRF